MTSTLEPRARWRCNQGAQDAFARDDTSRFPALVSGFRGGKTWAGARKALRLAGRNKCPGLLVGETHQQLRQIMVPAFLEACHEAGIGARWLVTHGVVVLDIEDARDPMYGGRVVVYTRSADKAERIAGFEVGWFWADEVGRWAYHPHEPMRDPWTQCIARLSDARAVVPQGIVTGTHEGKGTRLYEDWIAQPKDGHKIYTGSTRDNRRNLHEDYIRSLESSYDPVLLEQYLEGRAVEIGIGLAYYGYGAHCHAETTYDANKPLWWALDFNVAPMCSVVCQPHGEPPNGELHVIAELVLPTSANSGDLADAFASQFSGHRGSVVVFGDASGGHEDTRSKTDDWRLVYGILRRTFADRCGLKVPEANPPVRQRVARVNALCRDGLGRVRLRLDPRRVPVLARDLERVRWGKSGDIDKRDQSLSHASDALGYLVHVAYPIEQDTPARGGASGQMVSHQRGTPIDPRSTVAGRMGR